MYNNKDVYLCNAILVTKILCYRYSTINNSAKNNIFNKIRFNILLEIKWTRFY